MCGGSELRQSVRQFWYRSKAHPPRRRPLKNVDAGKQGGPVLAQFPGGMMRTGCRSFGGAANFEIARSLTV
jgi:hypothetical protein